MATVFERATPADFEELVDVANYVFSHAGGRTDFPSLLPKLYKPEYGTAAHHVVAREDGRIRAVVGAFPLPMRVAGEDLLAYGIGTVCVHPYRRSTGYMKALMSLAHEGIRAAGADFGCLGGQRQRYQYFGYDRCGQMVKLSVNRTNIRHAFGRDYRPVHTFRPLEEGDTALTQCLAWFNARPAHAVRESARFLDTLRSWYFGAWAIETQGEVVGYLVASKDGGEISEIVTGDGRDAAVLLADWLTGRGLEKAVVVLPPFEQAMIDALARIAEFMSVEPADNLAVFHFPRTVQAFLKLKGTWQTLHDGQLVLEVEGHAPFRILVADGEVRVEATDDAVNLKLTYADALAFLFSPLSSITASALEKRGTVGAGGFGPAERVLAASWFPLPLFFDKADNV